MRPRSRTAQAIRCPACALAICTASPRLHICFNCHAPRLFATRNHERARVGEGRASCRARQGQTATLELLSHRPPSPLCGQARGEPGGAAASGALQPPGRARGRWACHLRTGAWTPCSRTSTSPGPLWPCGSSELAAVPGGGSCHAFARAGSGQPGLRCNLPDGHASRPRLALAPGAARRTKLYESAGTTVADIWEETVDRWTMKEAIVQGDISLSFSVADEGAAPRAACQQPWSVRMSRITHAAGLRGRPARDTPACAGQRSAAHMRGRRRRRISALRDATPLACLLGSLAAATQSATDSPTGPRRRSRCRRATSSPW